MRKYRGVCPALILALLAGSVSGCGEEPGTEAEKNPYNPYAAVSGMETTPVVDYTVPRQQPNILTDAVGYALGYEKLAAVKGATLSGEFRLIDAATGEIAYTGAIQKAEGEAASELSRGTAEFSEFDVPGLYYLECDRLGQSYRFEIREDFYGDLFREEYELVLEDCGKGRLELTDAAALLAAYEWYGAVFPDEDGDQIPDVLREMKSWIAYREENGVEPEEEAEYAALLAKFSYLFQKYDRDYATDCLKRASTVYGQVQEGICRDADRFFALTELYRATGLYSYRRQIVDHKTFFENNSSYLEEREYLYAAMTYMATRQKVDRELCESFMGNLMNRSEELSRRYTEMIDPLAAKNNGEDELLRCAVELSCANYIMNNYQYTGITAEFLHYLMGQNAESACFYEAEERKIDYLLLFAHLASREV
ncbi:MAG: glycoside hydrolase family 9 protein [Roseburia sp.]|nr:glycoside hydrolase family 9 protein [Roseburia sp.]MCM1097952.1 glycoside hydrolase family 9 protein [Ruminococcus flavefaciens]